MFFFPFFLFMAKCMKEVSTLVHLSLISKKGEEQPKEQALKCLCVSMCNVCVYMCWGQFVNLYKPGSEISKHTLAVASTHKHSHSFPPKLFPSFFCFKSNSLLASPRLPHWRLITELVCLSGRFCDCRLPSACQPVRIGFSNT